MKILHVIDSLGIGGAQSFLYTLLNHWPDSKDEIHVLPLSHRVNNRARFVSLPNVHVYSSPIRHFSPVHLLRAAAILRSNTFDIVHAHLPVSIIWSVIHAGRGSQLVAHEHGEPGKSSNINSIFFKMFSKKIKVLLANSRAIQETILQNTSFSAERVQYLPCGIDLAHWRGVADVDEINLLENIGLSPSSIIIGFVGRLVEQKNPGLLLESYAKICAQYPNTHLLVIGDGPLRRNLEKRSVELHMDKQVHFLGFKEDVRPWMRLMKIGVIPSSYEPFGIVALEFMASSVPVVACAVGGLVEILEGGLLGGLAPPSDIDALAKMLEDILNAPEKRQDYVSKSLSLIERYDIRQIAVDTRAIYECVNKF